jgi:hypothetical protein
MVLGDLLYCKTAGIDSLHHGERAGELLLEVGWFFWSVKGKDFFVVGGDGICDDGGVRPDDIPVDHGVDEIVSCG